MPGCGGRGGRGGRGDRSTGGRGGRAGAGGRGSWRTSNLKFHPHGVGKDRQTVTYGKVKERIIMKVQKEYEYGRDIAESLRDMVVVDLSILRPRIEELQEKDPVKKAREEKAPDVVFQKKMDIYLNREEILKDNLGKAYC